MQLLQSQCRDNISTGLPQRTQRFISLQPIAEIFQKKSLEEKIESAS
jgi:hypothetical protein